MGNLLTAFDVLNDPGVPAVIIGGRAVNFHGHVRATEDGDLILITCLV
jgi:hypothetical protein